MARSGIPIRTSGCLGLCLSLLLLDSGARADQPVDFQRDVRPLLARQCFGCHGPDEKSRKARFRIDTRDGATGKDGGLAGIIPGSSATSRVMYMITDSPAPMPLGGQRLSPAEVNLIRRWIDQGAPYPEHWAFKKPVRPELPAVRDKAWVKNPIDDFVLSRLEHEGMRPSREADRYTLVRRLAFDLTGLPPSQEMVNGFVHDRNADAYERLVDRLLATPRYGERWARMWLDLARYADTQGYEKDLRRSMWPYRDWVIKAFNDNMPFDQFTIRQLAGDLLPSPTQDDLIATGFHRNTMTNLEGGIDNEEFRVVAVKDRVAVTGQVWMGMTWDCAQCHTHKYDPISHAEFYQLYAFLNQTEDANKSDDSPVLKLAQGSTLIMREVPPKKRRVSHIQLRGNFLDPGPEVEPATPAALNPFPEGAPRNRLGLAEWLVSPDNPLTARVTVNRFWARLFGRGIVETEEDFGTQGSPPSHPELLDWLATEFVEKHWDVKALLKTIVMSATYRQSSDASAALFEKDPYNVLLARGPRFRLDAEMIRDQALSIAGVLSSKMYGPPVMPWQPEGIWQIVYNADQWKLSSGEDRYRRGIYTFIRRTSPYPSLANYDAPTGEVCTMRRYCTDTPLQALTTLNDPVAMEAAERLALRTIHDAGKTDASRVEYMFRLALARPPQARETQRLLALHRDVTAELRSGKSPQQLLNYDKVLYSADRDTFLVADARGNAPAWRYTTEDPGAGWNTVSFDVSQWQSGKGPFGSRPARVRPVGAQKPASTQAANAQPAGEQRGEDPGGIAFATPWNSEQLWLRIEFEVSAQPFENPRLMVQSSAGFEAFINGVPAAASHQERSDYYEYRLHSQAAAALKPGHNVLAVRTYRTTPSQMIDLSLMATRQPDFGRPQDDDAARAAWVVVANTILNLDETLTRR